MNVNCIFRTSSDNIREFIKKNKGLVIVYGATVWGGELVDFSDINIDYFCDRKAEKTYYFHGIKVVNINELERLILKDKRRATIIICVGMNKGIVNSIFRDLVSIDVNADVFDYFENRFEFSDKDFILGDKKYNLFEHSFNCGYINARMTERSVELALAKDYINICAGKIIEIGAVTPYYYSSEKLEAIIDPTDIHHAVTKKSLFECDLSGKNVLSISTVEHIGTSDYGMREHESTVDAIEKILGESCSCLITAPLGYNKLLDKWVEENWQNKTLKVLRRHINNQWEEMVDEYVDIEYTKLWANGLVVISKNGI